MCNEYSHKITFAVLTEIRARNRRSFRNLRCEFRKVLHSESVVSCMLPRGL